MNITLIFADSSLPGQVDDMPACMSGTLKKIRSRGDTKPGKINVLSQLFSCFGIDMPGGDVGGDLPVAAASALVDFENNPQVFDSKRIWLRADPVFLRADLTTVLLFSSQHFKILPEEVEALFLMINPLLVDQGMQLICGDDPSRWYIGLDQLPLISTSSPDDVDGQNIQSFLPQGKDRGDWLRLGNEIQMVLHNAEINQRRIEGDEVPINGLWFWGGGSLPDQQTGHCRYSSLLSDHVIARGLAIHSGMSQHSIPKDFDSWLEQHPAEQDILIVLSANDMKTCDQQLLQPILKSRKKGRVKSLKLISNDWVCKLKKAHLMRFWRR